MSFPATGILRQEDAPPGPWNSLRLYFYPAFPNLDLPWYGQFELFLFRRLGGSQSVFGSHFADFPLTFKSGSAFVGAPRTLAPCCARQAHRDETTLGQAGYQHYVMAAGDDGTSTSVLRSADGH